MRKSILLLLLLGTAGFAATSRHLGGWAVVTIDDLPDYAVAGQPVKLSFVVRQHGMTPLLGLHPVVEARSGSTNISVKALAVPDSGLPRYAAILDLSHPGEWTVTIHSGFWGKGEVTLLPLPVVSSRTTPRALSDAERGRRLFMAKGCFTCHVNREVTTAEGLKVGPDLTGRRYPPEALAKFLARPDSMQLTQLPRNGPFRMPVLGLKDREIASLVAMINTGRQLSDR